MPIISMFPTADTNGGAKLAPVSNIQHIEAHGRVYIKWTDPEDVKVDGATVAEWGGTVLKRQAGHYPKDYRDGFTVIDSTDQNKYQNEYFEDTGLSDGVTYYYKFFPYTKRNSHTDDPANEFKAKPQAVPVSNVYNISTAAAGNGKLHIKWTDPMPYINQDGVRVATWGKTVVIVKDDGYATEPDETSYVYKTTTTTQDIYSSSPLLVSGLENGRTYYITFFPITTEGAVNLSEANRATGVPNRLEISSVPYQSGTLTYNGSNQSPSWVNYDTTKMYTGTNSQTNAGSYYAYFYPHDDYCWSDGTTGSKSVRWTINKAQGSLSLSKTSITLNSSKKSDSFTVTRAGDGAISAQSNDISVARVSVSGTTVHVDSVNDKAGIATITVSVAEGTNYTAPASKPCTVSCEFLPVIGTPLNDISWAGIKRISDAGLAKNYFHSGDRKAVKLNGKCTDGLTFNNETYYAYILGIDHNSSKEGGNRVHFQFGYNDLSGGWKYNHICFIDSGYDERKTSGTWFNMNNQNSNSGGWKSSRMRTVVMPQFKNCLPPELRAVLKSVTKYSDNTGGGSDNAGYVTATTDELFLIAEFEIFGVRDYANSAEQNYQQQYQFYKDSNSRVMYKHSSTTYAAHWWLRSVVAYPSAGFCRVDTSGRAYFGNVYFSFGFAPAFCV